ncbi:MAG: hypothetical protein M1438_04835 [Deltaproteobacteria bacterium]|nr:hypothetical protein [Deltaproteobacteria bacterium]
MEILEAKLMGILAEHRGKANPIGMGELFRKVYGEDYEHRINDTDKLRGLIRKIRRRGEVPLCSTDDRRNPGYFLAETAAELQEFFDWRRGRVLSSLEQISHMERHAMAALKGQAEMEAG